MYKLRIMRQVHRISYERRSVGCEYYDFARASIEGLGRFVCTAFAQSTIIPRMIGREK